MDHNSANALIQSISRAQIAVRQINLLSGRVWLLYSHTLRHRQICFTASNKSFRMSNRGIGYLIMVHFI